MKIRLGAAGLLLVLLAATPLLAEEVAGLTLHVERLNPQTIRVWLGDFISSTAMVAVATEKGIVLIDTFGIPAIDRELRKVIARELGRGDFRYLINTHEHGDHTGGNAVYADCTIIAHELCAAGMKPARDDRQRVTEWYTNRIAELGGEIEKLPVADPRAKSLKEELVLDKLNLQDQQAAAEPVFPAKTFKDRMKLESGGTTFELYYTGGMHSASDISVFIPQSGLLMTGDTMADIWLTETPGCLAAFLIRNVEHNFPLLLENWNLLLAKKDQIKDLITGHWNGDLTMKGFENRVHYIQALWDGINLAVKEGRSLDTLFGQFRLRQSFPDLVNSPGITAQNHYGNITGIWSHLTNTVSAAGRIFELLDQGGQEAAIDQILQEHGKTPSKYYYLEAEFNQFGYQLMNGNTMPRALVMFRANTRLFPRSWNAWDSLGEACMNAGNREEAIQYYEKSIELNPENQNGKDKLKELRTPGK